MNFLEELISEWCEFQAYFVRCEHGHHGKREKHLAVEFTGPFPFFAPGAASGACE